MADQDNREECPDCKGSGLDILCSEESYGLGYETKCTTCNGTGEVTTDSGANVCEWEEVSYKTFANCKDYYIDIPDWIPYEDLKTCLFCGKPITIKGECDEYILSEM